MGWDNGNTNLQVKYSEYFEAEWEPPLQDPFGVGIEHGSSGFSVHIAKGVNSIFNDV